MLGDSPGPAQCPFSSLSAVTDPIFFLYIALHLPSLLLCHLCEPHTSSGTQIPSFQTNVHQQHLKSELVVGRVIPFWATENRNQFLLQSLRTRLSPLVHLSA